MLLNSSRIIFVSVINITTSLVIFCKYMVTGEVLTDGVATWNTIPADSVLFSKYVFIIAILVAVNFAMIYFSSKAKSKEIEQTGDFNNNYEIALNILLVTFIIMAITIILSHYNYCFQKYLLPKPFKTLP